MEEKMRLQKAMAHRGLCSRRKAEELIAQGKVSVNGKIVTELGTTVQESDVINVNGVVLSKEEDTVAFLFNKPTGVVSTSQDDRGRKTILDFFSSEPYRLYPAGRLDMNTSGAIIVTNDGELSDLITHPSSHLDKTYIASLRESITEAEIKKLEEGILLEDGMTAPSIARILKNDAEKVLVKITIHEGRNRQVRRMFEALNHRIKALHRVSIGFLDVRTIERGTYRKLSQVEIESLKKMCKDKRVTNVIPDYKKK